MTAILVIEDEPQVRRNIQDILELSGFSVQSAATGHQGVALAQQMLPDLIISDVMMPEMDGFEVVQALKNQPETARIPFIFLTAKASRQDWRQAMNLGADDYLTKPFTPQELLEAIQTRLQRAEELTRPYKTQLAETSAHLHYISCHDPLTQLLNIQGLQQVFGTWQLQHRSTWT
ncbi:MAG: response regulator [Prochlorothrix sp.]|nr:response regulator [Prochlorothrix sp.]